MQLDNKDLIINYSKKIAKMELKKLKNNLKKPNKYDILIKMI